MAERVPILLAEDEPDDAHLIRTALEELEASNPLHLVESGDDAVSYLAGEGKFAERASYPFPGFMLLDLKLPGKSGVEVLRWLNQQPSLKSKLSVAVLSSLLLPENIEELCRLGVASSMEKPTSYHDLVQLMRSVKEQFLDRPRPS